MMSVCCFSEMIFGYVVYDAPTRQVTTLRVGSAQESDPESKSIDIPRGLASDDGGNVFVGVSNFNIITRIDWLTRVVTSVILVGTAARS